MTAIAKVERVLEGYTVRRVSDLKDESLSQMAANPEDETSGSKEKKREKRRKPVKICEVDRREAVRPNCSLRLQLFFSSGHTTEGQCH